MEIKEEGTSEEGQHFLSTAQANDSDGTQFTSKYVCASSCNSVKMQVTLTENHCHAFRIMA